MEKTLNNSENKAKLFSLYYGQRVLCIRKNESPELYVGFDDMRNNKVRDEDYLSLRPISSLTDEELLHIAGIFDLSPEQIADTDLQEWVEALFSELAGYYIDGYTGTQIQQLSDYLRSKGILIPWMDLSIDHIKEYGWAIEKEA